VALGLAVGLVALAACGIDKDGTAQDLIDEIEANGIGPLDADQRECVTDVVRSYGDDDIEDVLEQRASAELRTEFQDRLQACLDAGTPPAAPTT